ncbi:DNA-3-methyladenine glycosylase 1 [Hypsizygus marmoreus]|uniref:DNA-3-methyladenine glycosylase 1 n=1 Tax=Hypsizygus marmoreus TaxID=39966 RepID=A0A369J433_HYPMA|nr:DNA-3-methyladenine glycosylase 1 [Hypsizygus marmoreus]
MRTTRSTSRAIANGANQPSSTGEKRKPETEPASKSNQKRSRVAKAATSTQGTPSTLPQAPLNAPSVTPALVPAVLMFSFEDAKRHLIGVDHRFEDLFDKMVCKPFQHLERVHPFRALVTSILGQQISWMAARSINHRFIRLYDPSIPEKHTDYEEHKNPTSFFPTPQQVVETDLATLRSAGLSGRKAEYVKDLATRFADGRLSTEKLVQASDDELAQMLIEVRGIGRWTVDMFAIFSLRRPDILPVGDLGVQQKVGGQLSPKKETAKAVTPPADNDELPVFGAQNGTSNATIEAQDQDQNSTLAPDVSSVPPTTDLEDEESDGEEIASMPPAFTPSIRKTLNKSAVDPGSNPVPLPEGLSVAVLKSRLDSKKKIKGAFLTPKEMEDLTECWKPYRSIAVYYMWSLADVTE